MYLKDMGCKAVYWPRLAQDRVQWRDFVSNAMNFFQCFKYWTQSNMLSQACTNPGSQIARATKLFYVGA
jgi:hypothetical protein